MSSLRGKTAYSPQGVEFTVVTPRIRMRAIGQFGNIAATANQSSTAPARGPRVTRGRVALQGPPVIDLR